ncbi:MAG: hypothetical protein AAF550_11825, partial [Myxococcota bacterium]
AATHLNAGRGDAFLVGGGEVCSEPLQLAMRKLARFAPSYAGGAHGGGSAEDPGRASQCLRLGEGAVFLAVERTSDAHDRGAHVLARLAGFGTAFEPPSSEAQLVGVSREAIERAARGAISDAGLRPCDIDVVCGASCSARAVDTEEIKAWASVFGEQTAVVAPKRLYGETFGAAGAFGMLHALSWFQGAPIQPLLSGHLPSRVEHVLIATVGFYGNVSAAVLARTS